MATGHKDCKRKQNNGFVVPRYDGEDEEDQVLEGLVPLLTALAKLDDLLPRWRGSGLASVREWFMNVSIHCGQISRTGIVQRRIRKRGEMCDKRSKLGGGVSTDYYGNGIQDKKEELERKAEGISKVFKSVYRFTAKSLPTVLYLSPYLIHIEMIQDEKKSLKALKGVEDCS
ncbi:hypothetical protein SELMODRAFT_429909 [Selaginella moellendorffii]|uniref:Uncharacterized protein n=1 Tax=Selaginella moellendorffii TaxID=88036 RepID=D8T7Q3_SELML|nr:hypothetical protein SELMODRAFT_429909 [Selaginella moellendorffii]